jgi:hypothetical protein
MRPPDSSNTDAISDLRLAVLWSQRQASPPDELIDAISDLRLAVLWFRTHRQTVSAAPSAAYASPSFG